MGAIKLLRGLFEGTVTLKYLADNKGEVDAFLKYDAVDWDAILSGIKKRFNMTGKPDAMKHVHDVATEVKKQFKRCKECGMRQQNSWSPLNSVAMAEKVGLGYLHFECFVVPSKFIHPTYFGASQVSKAHPAPLENILKATHILTLETVLAHQRYFHGDPLATPAVTDAIQAFLKTWKYSETDFGLGKDAARAGITFMPLPPPERPVIGRPQQKTTAAKCVLKKRDNKSERLHRTKNDDSRRSSDSRCSYGCV